MPRGRDATLAFFIPVLCESKNLAAFPYRFFHFVRPLHLRSAMDVAERNDLAACNAKEKRSSCERENFSAEGVCKWM